MLTHLAIPALWTKSSTSVKLTDLYISNCDFPKNTLFALCYLRNAKGMFGKYLIVSFPVLEVEECLEEFGT